MVIQDKKTRGIRISVDLRKLNDACLHDPFPTPFTNEVLENIGRVGGLLVHRWILRIPSDKDCTKKRHKMRFVTEWGSFSYTVISFGLNNAPPVFFAVVVATFKEFIHKFLEVYLDYLAIFNLLKDHIDA
jgi:hypothetical protein